jgi:hypothetical protein
LATLLRRAIDKAFYAVKKLKMHIERNLFSHSLLFHKFSHLNACYVVTPEASCRKKLPVCEWEEAKKKKNNKKNKKANTHLSNTRSEKEIVCGEKRRRASNGVPAVSLTDSTCSHPSDPFLAREQYFLYPFSLQRNSLLGASGLGGRGHQLPPAACARQAPPQDKSSWHHPGRKTKRAKIRMKDQDNRTGRPLERKQNWRGSRYRPRLTK